MLQLLHPETSVRAVHAATASREISKATESSRSIGQEQSLDHPLPRLVHVPNGGLARDLCYPTFRQDLTAQGRTRRIALQVPAYSLSTLREPFQFPSISSGNICRGPRSELRAARLANLTC